MKAAIANSIIPDIQEQAREMTKRHLLQWFDWMDRTLDMHRSNFVFREPTPKELDEHKIALKRSIRYCNFINALIADPDFNDPDLTSRLQIRIRQMEDAYNTFHDSELSDEKAEQILSQV